MKHDIYPTPEAVANAAADLISRAITSEPNLSLGLAGGSTPRRVHSSLASRELAWDGVTAWMTDERWVGPDRPESNQRMARETLVVPTGVPFVAPDTTGTDPEAAAEAYASILDTSDIGSDRPSVVMLGIGTDGHTASLFPETAALGETERSYVANWVGALGAWRLTTTFGLLARIDTVLFVVTGASKAPVIRQLADGAELPAAAVRARREVIWLLDAAAASEL